MTDISYKKKVKILIAYHKPDENLFNDEILTPIHVGRAIARNRLPEKNESFSWMESHMIGDDTGENISNKNFNYNEMTALYWAWKNYDTIGNPDYLGLMHYRRHFIFKGGERSLYECVKKDDNYHSYLGYSEQAIIQLLDHYDFIAPKTQRPGFDATVYEHYKMNHYVEELDDALTIIKQHYPEMTSSAEKYLNGKDAYYYNMFILPRELFFQYAQWIFDIMSKFEKDIEKNNRRFFLSERLTGIFITYLIDQGKKGCFLPTCFIKGIVKIPVAFATDDNYALQTYVAMHSIMKHSSSGSVYRFIIMSPSSLSENSKQMMLAITEQYESCTVEFIDTLNDFIGVDIHISHITAPTYYRLRLPKYLLDCDKIIYLDSDILVCDDLQKLYDINIEDYYVAGVKALGYHVRIDIEEYCINNGLQNIDRYINAGVLLMNLKKIRQDGLDKKFIEMSTQHFESQDQDIINIACYARIKTLPFRFNVMTKYYKWKQPMYKGVYSQKEIEEAWSKPLIIHFADKIKPWDDFYSPLAKIWWDYLENTPMRGRIRRQKVKKSPLVQKKPDIYKSLERRLFSNAKVSIIIPIYNAEKLINECLNSVLKQTLKDIEIICVDDGSTDNTPSILLQYATSDPRIVVLWQENFGASVARNYALHEARGEYITFMDSDDYYYDPAALEQMYTYAKKHNVKVCAGLRLSHNHEGKVTKQPLYREVCKGNPDGLFAKYVDYQHDYHYHSYLYDRKMITENHLEFPNVIRFQDPPFFIRAMYIADEYYIYPAELYCYRVSNKPITTWNAETILAVLNGLKDSLDFSREKGLAVLHWVSAMRISYEYGEAILNFLKRGNLDILQALAYANKALDQDLIYSVNNGGISKAKLAGVFYQLDKRIQQFEGTYVLEPLLQLGYLLYSISSTQPSNLDEKPKRNNENIEILRAEIRIIQASRSYRIGRFITWLPRKTRSFVMCLKENGIKYTLNLVKCKLLGSE
ncbi:MAG: DUF4422 domain-containing protein [Eubacteriaceae bacterium]